MPSARCQCGYLTHPQVWSTVKDAQMEMTGKSAPCRVTSQMILQALAPLRSGKMELPPVVVFMWKMKFMLLIMSQTLNNLEKYDSRPD